MKLIGLDKAVEDINKSTHCFRLVYLDVDDGSVWVDYHVTGTEYNLYKNLDHLLVMIVAPIAEGGKAKVTCEDIIKEARGVIRGLNTTRRERIKIKIGI